jgi:predicted RNA-binding Zn ribbon-like protein
VPGPGSSARLGLDPAPGGLVLVQDLVNTSLAVHSSSVEDLLGSAAAADAWLDAALASWSARTGQPALAGTVTEADLPRLRALRDAVRELVTTRTTDDDALTGARVQLRLDGGRVTYGGAGAGSARLAGLVGTELLLAQHAGTWPRLRCCANPRCGTAFYDRSRNASRVWHDTQVCGNAINLRASRARRAGRASR